MMQSQPLNHVPGSSQGQPGVQVLEVQPGSPAEKIGISTGDRLLALNDHQIHDILDYWFHVSADRLRISWITKDGEKKTATIKKPYDQRLGIELEPFEIKRCSNACVFCFVHQLPRGMRRELYIKDEDYRLSFLYGNYITGTNLSPADKQRIIDYKLSPLFFSIHATDQEVREQLLVKRNIEPVVPMLKALTEHGIYVHCQIVLCPGINDGEILRKTVADLATLYPYVESIAVVPLGMTDHRERLPKLQDVTPEYARQFVQFCAQLQEETRKTIGYPLIFPSDEFFLIGDLEPPSYGQYPEIPQLANGVGMYYRFYQEVEELIKYAETIELPNRKVAAITTHQNRKVLGRLIEQINTRLAPLHVDLLCVTNTLFGSGINVSGLLPGKDFLAAIKDNPDYDRYLIPANALRAWDKKFLDDMTLEELQALAGNVEIQTGGDTAASFLEACL